MSNIDIRAAALQSGVRLWQIADALGVSAETVSRKMRKELSESEKAKFLEIIKKIAKGEDRV